MHYLPDTDDEDAIRERYWPDGYKLAIRSEVRDAVVPGLQGTGMARIYRRSYRDTFQGVSEFIDCIVGGIIIGAENGADEGFESVYESFIAECELPEIYRYARAFRPPNISKKGEGTIHRAIVKDFGKDDGFSYAYKDGYDGKYASYEDFIDRVADIMVAGARNGVYSAFERFYRAFFYRYPLPPMRRNPRRLKTW
jgi:hypothetical protein